MTAGYTYDPGLVVDDVTNLPSVNASGSLVASVGGAPLAVYDLLGTPIDHLVTNANGYVARFRADVPTALVSFGSVNQPVVSFEAINSGPQAIASASAATAAATAAAASNTAAQAALTAALAAQAAAEAGGGTSSSVIDGGGIDGSGSTGDFDGGLI
jgi:hypothetical protein